MRLPFTLRLIAAILRSAVSGFLIFLGGWLVFIPATAEERAALNAANAPVSQERLVPMRIARAALHFAPDVTARTLARRSRGEFSPELVTMMLREIANGGPGGGSTAPPQDANATSGGAKFISVTP